MKIGLNGQKILIENPAGPEKYTINLFKSLAKIDKENEYVIYLNRKPQNSFFNDLVRENNKFSFKIIKCPLFWTQLGLAIELIINPVDVFFTAVHTIPIIKCLKTKYVVMIHGLEYKFTKGYKNPLSKFTIERPVKYAIKNSDKIIVPTKSTKNEILKRKWIKDESMVEIINEGVTDNFYNKNLNGIERVRKKYKIGDNPYLLFVSTIQPRKNIPNMIKAFSIFLKENENFKGIKILLAGKNGWDFEESLEAPKKYGIENNIEFIGRVPDEDLPYLFQGSLGHINLSFEEGFGLPLAESLTSGVKSLVSDIPPYREVGYM